MMNLVGFSQGSGRSEVNKSKSIQDGKKDFHSINFSGSIRLPNGKGIEGDEGMKVEAL